MTKSNKKGTSLVELLAVIVIMGIIAAIAVPTVGALLKNTRIKAAKSDMEVVYGAAQTYFAAESKTTVDAKTLLEGNYASIDVSKITTPEQIVFNQAENGSVTITCPEFTYEKDGKLYKFAALSNAAAFEKPSETNK